MRFPFPLPTLPRPRPPAAAAPVAASGTQGRLFDEELLARLRRLVLLSNRAVAEGLAGEHRSRRRGASPEFADFKSYSQGDDFRRIDWNTYARLDSLFVRLSEVTTELSLHVLLDVSNSMDWRGSPRVPTKSAYARRVAGALGYVALWHFDRLTIAPFGQDLAPAFGPAHGRAHVVPMLRYLEALPPLGRTDLPATLDRYVRARRRPGMLLLVSDLLSGEPAELRDVLRTMWSRGWHAIVVHVLDQAELTPALAGRYLAGETVAGAPTPQAELLEVETGDRLRLSPTDGVLARYGAAVAAWLAEIEEVCAGERADYLRMMTDWPVETIVLRLLHERGLLE
jgi:uncharacterized protein (DUF58 family)